MSKRQNALPEVKHPGRPSQGRGEEARDKFGLHTTLASVYPGRLVQLGAPGYREYSCNTPECLFAAKQS